MSRESSIELFLFTTLPALAGVAEDAGIDAVVVDWEWRGKEDRQEGRDTEINRDTAADLAGLSGFRGRRCCRLNGFGPWTPGEVELAIENGATDLLLPMVREVAEVEHTQRLVGDRVPLGILVETVSAVARARQLARLRPDRVYVGLNDLAIDRGGKPELFRPLIDGTLEKLREAFHDRPFGFGGLTQIDLGKPVPCVLLLQEMARLEADFCFLRRSFKRDVPPTSMAREVLRLRESWSKLKRRGAAARERNHRHLQEHLAALYHLPLATR